MILDAFLRFTGASGQALTSQAATASTDVIDLHMSGIPALANLQGARDLGIGTRLKLTTIVTTTFTSGGAGTLSVAIQGAPDNGSGVPGSYTTWWLSPTYALATLVVGARLYEIDMPRPPAGVGVPRFLRMLYTVATADFTAGVVQSFIVLDRDDYMYQGTSNAIPGGYPAGLTVAN